MGNPLEKIVGYFKKGYYFLEDRYYHILDKINQHIPVYKITDPIDKIVPSFALLIALAFLLAVFFIVVFTSGGVLTATIKVVDNQNQVLDGTLVNLVMDGQTVEFLTDGWGEARVDIPEKEIKAEALFSKDGFQDLKSSIFLLADETVSVTMQPEIPAVSLQDSDRTIKVVDSKTNRTISNVTLSFVCTNGGFAPPSQSGNTGEFKVVQPSNCPTLTATADASGYDKASKSISSSVTYIRMTSKSTTGSITVIVKDDSGNKEPDVTVRALDETSNSEKASSSTSLSGTALLSDLAPGNYTVSASSPDGRTGQKSGILVSVGETTTITITLPNADQVDMKKIYLKLIEQGTSNPVSNAQAFIYENNVLIDSTASTSLGIVEKNLSNPDSSYLVVLTHSDFVTKIESNIPLKELSDTEPINVPMARSTLEQPNPTSAKITLTVLNEALEPVQDAEATLYDVTYPEIPLNTPPGQTLENGSYTFTNLAPGTYFARATFNPTGVSGQITVVAGESALLELILVLGEGAVEVLVFNQESSLQTPVSGATVNFVDANGSMIVIASCQTDVDGKCESNPIPADREILVMATAANFVSEWSVSTIDIMDGVTADVSIGLMPEISISPEIGKIDTIFEGLYEDSDAEIKTAWVQSDKLGTLSYYARFELLFTEDISYTDIVQHVRAGLDSELNLPLPNGYKIKIMGVTGPLFTAAPMSSCWNNSAQDPFIDPLECPDGMQPSVDTSAKQVNLYYPDLEGIQVVPFVVKFNVEPGLEDGEELKLHYIAKATSGEETTVTANKVKIFLVDAALCEDEEFAWAFNLTKPDGSIEVIDTALGAINQLSMNEAYTLSYRIYNCSNRDFFNATIFAENTAPVPTSVSFVSSEPFDHGPKALTEQFSFQKDTEISGEVQIYSVLETVSTGLQFTLDTEDGPSYKKIGFAIESNLELKVTHTPDKLNPNIGSQTLYGKVMDSVLQEAAPIEGATVFLEVATGTLTTITGSAGEFMISGIEQLAGLSSVTITVRKAGYKTFESEIEVGTSPPIPNPNLECISIEKNSSSDVSIRFEKPALGATPQTDTFAITNGCDSTVVIQLNSELRTENGIDSSEPFDLNPSYSETITVYAETVENSPYPIYMGEYGIGLMAKLASDDSAAGFSGPLAVARVYVTDPNSKFRLADPEYPSDDSAMKSSFDLKAGPSDGLIRNKDYTYFEDLMLPMVDKVHDYSAVEELFSLIYTPLTQPGVEKLKQKVDFDSQTNLFTNQADFDEGGNLFINIVDSGGYVFINWIDFLMTDEEHNGGNRHRVWAQTSRDSWTNVTSELPYTASAEAKEPEIEKIIVTSAGDKEETYQIALASDKAFGDGWHKVYVEGSTIADRRLSFPAIDNVGWVDTETYYLQGTKFLEDVTINAIWQGQHNICNLNLDGPDSTLAGCAVDGYRSSAVSMPYSIGHIANTIALESKGDPELLTKVTSAKWSYISTDKDHKGWIDFTIRNNILMGEEYALIEVEDSTGVADVISEGADAEGDITLTYQVFKRGLLVTNTQTTPVNRSSSNPLELDDGDILAISVEGSSKIFSGESLENIYSELKPDNPKRVTAITFTSNSDTNEFEMDRQGNTVEPPYVKYYIYSDGSWSNASFFDIGPDEVGVDDKFWTWTAGLDLLPQAEVIAFENNSNTTVKIDKIMLDYILMKENEILLDTTTTTIRSGEPFLTNELPPNQDLVGIGDYQDVRYVLSEDSQFATVTFSDTGTTISEDPYSTGANIVVSVSTPEQESQHGTERFHIRLIGQSQDQCVGKDGLRGSTGPGAEPRILLNWDWDSINFDSCDSTNPDFIYCDPTQFTISLIKRLEKMRELAEDDLTENLPTLRQMQEFNAYLIEDAYTDDFRHDFVDYYSDQLFSADVLNHIEHPWKKYLVDNTGRFEFDTTNASSNGGQDTGLVDAGMHEIYMGLLFDNDQFNFFNADVNTDLLANIKVEIIKNSDPITQNPFYHLPFNGEIGIYEGGARDDYGIEFNNENQPLAVIKSPLGASFETDSSSGRKSIDTAVLSDFGAVNNTDAGLLLNVLQNQTRIVFAPSTATPVLLQMAPDQGKVEAYYWLRDVSGNILLSSTTFMNSWTGTGSTMKPDGTCVDYYGSNLANRILDSSVVDGTCAASVPGSYGFVYGPVQEEQLYFETVFYVPESYELNLRKSCQNNSYFYSPNGRTETTNTPLSLTYTDSRTRAVTLENVLNLITDEYVCVSSDNKGYYFWWNPQKVISELDTVKSTIPDWPEASCNIS